MPTREGIMMVTTRARSGNAPVGRLFIGTSLYPSNLPTHSLGHLVIRFYRTLKKSRVPI